MPGTELRTTLHVIERNLCEEDAGVTLSQIAAGTVGRSLLPFIPLMRGSGESTITEQWKQLAEAEPNDKRRADYAGLALVFAERAGCWQAWKQALEEWNVEVSQQVLEWQAIAEKRGEARGEARGRAKALILMLPRLFERELPTEAADKIRTTTDVAVLDRWLEAATQAPTLDDFLRQLDS